MRLSGTGFAGVAVAGVPALVCDEFDTLYARLFLVSIASLARYNQVCLIKGAFLSFSHGNNAGYNTGPII